MKRAHLTLFDIQVQHLSFVVWLSVHQNDFISKIRFKWDMSTEFCLVSNPMQCLYIWHQIPIYSSFFKIAFVKFVSKPRFESMTKLASNFHFPFSYPLRISSPASLYSPWKIKHEFPQERKKKEKTPSVQRQQV